MPRMYYADLKGEDVYEYLSVSYYMQNFYYTY